MPRDFNTAGFVILAVFYPVIHISSLDSEIIVAAAHISFMSQTHTKGGTLTF